MTRIWYLVGLATLMIVDAAYSQSLISCQSTSKQSTQSIQPEPYISQTGALCFNVKSWPGYSGDNCTTTANGTVSWQATILLIVEGDSKGRDLFYFRVTNATVSDSHISYKIQWRRDEDWQPMQNVTIDRLTGKGIRYFNSDHASEFYKCRAQRKKF